MHNITLISTNHAESGKCNSDELYKIIQSIRPDLIFEEKDPDLFDRVYNKNQFSEELLETKSIKRYLQNYDIKHFPVDIDITQNISVRDYHRIRNTFRQNGVYKKLDDEHCSMIKLNGFSYLNSKESEKMIDKKRVIEKNLIKSMINQNKPINFHKLIYDDREIAMLQNIYNYSKENQYNQAVFLIGAGHRKSIMQKITEYEKQSDIKLNWRIYGNK